MNLRQVEELKSSAESALGTARQALGLALLAGQPADEARSALDQAEWDLRDAECMLSAFQCHQIQLRATSDHSNTPSRPNIPMAEYQDARSAFQNRYADLKTSGAVIHEANKLVEIARGCGGFAFRDCQTFLATFRGSPELVELTRR